MLRQETSQAYIFPLLDMKAQKSILAGYDVRNKEYLSDIEAYIDFICQERNITIKQIRSKRRDRFIVEARQWVCYYYTKFCTENRIGRLTYNKIGEALDKDHATIIYTIRAAQNMHDTDLAYNEDSSRLYAKLIDKANIINK